MNSLSSNIFYQKQKSSPIAKLSLISLMDIFTILVFFLLLNSGEAEKIQNAKFVSLPDSNVGTAPHKEVAIIIEEDKLWFENKLIGEIDELIAQNPGKVIPELSAVLAEYAENYKEKKGGLNSFEKRAGMSVAVLGDKSVPYILIKSIMETCQENDLRNISLAVNQTVKGAYQQPSQLAANLGSGG